MNDDRIEQIWRRENDGGGLSRDAKRALERLAEKRRGEASPDL